MTLSELMAHLQEFDEVLVHADEVTHDDDDSVSSHNFVLEPLGTLICRPQLDMHSYSTLRVKGARGLKNLPLFPWFTGASPIDYVQRLEDALKKVWSAIEQVDENSECVGVVHGVEIYRTVSIYQKAEI